MIGRAGSPTSLSGAPRIERKRGEASLPASPQTLLVVSDLHLSEGRDLHTGRYRRNENFFADAAFRRFLAYHNPQRARSAVLVLNGDTFDFDRITVCPEDERELREWGCHLSDLGIRKTRGELAGSISLEERRYGLGTHDFKSVWKLSRISRGHRGFFEALGWWLERGGWIVLVKGNHDLELHWPLVQEAIRREIGRSHPDADVDRRVLFRDHSLQVCNVYVEHGHRFDATAAVNGPPTVSSGRELNKPLASLVTRYVTNPMEGVEPFLDNIKPVKRLLWTLVRRHPFKAPEILRRLVPVLRKSFAPRRLEDTAWLVVYVAALTAPLLALAAITLALAGYLIAGATDHLPVNLLAVIAIVGLAGPYMVGLTKTLAPGRRTRVGEDRYAERLYWTLHRSQYPAGCARVFGVLGHTHRPDVQRLEPFGRSEVLYVNAGSWTPPWKGDRRGVSGLVRNAFLRFDLVDGGEYELTYLEWDDERNEPVATTILEPRKPRSRVRFLSRRERRTVEAFADTFMDSGTGLSAAEVAAKVEVYLSAVRSSRIRRLRLCLRLIEYVAPLPLLRPFSRLSGEDRRRVVQRRLTRSRRSWLRKELARLRALCLMAYYGDERSGARIGFTPFERRSRSGEDTPSPNGGSRLRLADPRTEAISCDVCVVGSGASGAVIACRAAAAGQDVVLIEEGRYLHSSEIGRDESSMLAALYRDGGLPRTLHLDWGVAQGCCLGGTAAVGNAVSFRVVGDPDLRHPETGSVLQRWRGVGAAIDEAALQDAFERIEATLRVERLSPVLAGGNARLFLDGWRRLLDQELGDPAFSSNLFRTSYDRSVGFGYCSLGGPYDRRRSTLETFISDAIGRGARVIPACRAEAFAHGGSAATVLRCRLGDGSPLAIRADRFVIACGSIGSSLLLRRSGVRKNVGSRVSPNLTASVYARFARPLNGFEGAALGAFVDSGTFILQSAFRPPASFAVALPGWFEVHADRMRHYSRLAAGSVLIGTEPNARIRRFAMTREWLGPLAYRMTQPDFENLKEGMALLTQLYFAAGAESVYLSAFRDLEMAGRDFAPRGRINPGKIARFIARHVAHPTDLVLESPYVQGGNPMSDDPDVGVVDSRFRVHGFENLFVCDASVFPSSTRGHPQLTVMAMADYAWHTSFGMGEND